MKTLIKIIAIVLKISLISLLIFIGIRQYSNNTNFGDFIFACLVFIPASMGYESIIKEIIEKYFKSIN